jgi:hypothetical protein
MLYREIIAVCCEIHTEHKNKFCNENSEFLYVKAGGVCSGHWPPVLAVFSGWTHINTERQICRSICKQRCHTPGQPEAF